LPHSLRTLAKWVADDRFRVNDSKGMPRINPPRCARPRRTHRSAQRALPALLALLLTAAPAARAARISDGGLLYDGIAAPDAGKIEALAKYHGAGEARLLDWLTDGSLLVADDDGHERRLLRLTAAGSGAALAHLPAAPLAAAAQPYRDGQLALLMQSAAGGAPFLALQSLAGGEPTPLLDAGSTRGAPAWARDGHRIAFSAGAPGSGDFALYVIDTADPAGLQAHRLEAGTAADWQVLGWTLGDRALLVRHPVSAAGDELLLVDVGSGALTRVDAPGERAPGYAAIGDAELAPDGRGVYFIATRDGHAALRYADFHGDGSRTVAACEGHEPTHFSLGADGRLIACSWDDAGGGRVQVFDRRSGALLAAPPMPSGRVYALRFDRAGTRLAIDTESASLPRGVYVHDSGDGSLARWTTRELNGLEARTLPATRRVQVPTWDHADSGRQRTLDVELSRPRTPGAHAVLLLLDDAGLAAGPGSPLELYRNFCVQELQLAVVSLRLREGEAGLLDLGAVLAWIGAQPDLRRERVAVLGTGSGGGAALAALGLYGDRLRAALSVDGTAEGVPLSLIRGPALLVRGLTRPPLSAAAAEQLLWRLRSANVPAALIAPHDIDGQVHPGMETEAARAGMAGFLATWLADAASPQR
jgi:hypothetical protein